MVKIPIFNSMKEIRKIKKLIKLFDIWNPNITFRKLIKLFDVWKGKSLKINLFIEFNFLLKLKEWNYFTPPNITFIN